VLRVDRQSDIVGIEVRSVRDRGSGAYVAARESERQTAQAQLLAHLEKGGTIGASAWKWDRDELYDES
jgi:hypothetical protein